MTALLLVRVAHTLGVRLDWLLAGTPPQRLHADPWVRIDPSVATDPAVEALTRELSSHPPRTTDSGANQSRRRSR